MTCEDCQQQLSLGARASAGTELATHLASCSECQSFETSVDSLRKLAAPSPVRAPNEMVERALDRLRPVLQLRSQTTRTIRVRLALAGLGALPVILVLNALLVWTVARALGWLAPPLGWVVASLGVMSTFLGISLLYGALPLLASWGVSLRQRGPWSTEAPMDVT